MKIILLVNAMFIWGSFAWSYSSLAAVESVNDANFKTVVLDSGKWVFVDFYADWCRHCKKLMPEMVQVAQNFHAYSDTIQIVKINGDTDGKRMSKKYVNVGYPTMLMYHGSDDPVEYDGSRDSASITNFIQHISGIRLNIERETKTETNSIGSLEQGASIPERNPIIELLDLNFDELVLHSNKKSIVLFSASWCGICTDFSATFNVLAKTTFANDAVVQFGKVSLDTTSSHIIGNRYQAEQLPAIRLFENGMVVPYTGKRDIETLVTAINAAFGLHRKIDGTLLSLAGRIADADLAVAEILGGAHSLVQAGQELMLALESMHNDNQVQSQLLLKYYTKLTQKIIRGEHRSIPVEIARIKGILTNDREMIKVGLVESMQHRLNILKVFSEYANL